MDPATLAVWSDALNVPNMAAMDSAAVASTFAAAADGVMLRLRRHVVADQVREPIIVYPLYTLYTPLLPYIHLYTPLYMYTHHMYT